MVRKAQKHIREFLTTDFFKYLHKHPIQARIFFTFVGISIMIFSGWLGFWIGISIFINQVDLTKLF